MFINELKVKNYKCLRDNCIKFRVPNGTYGSGLNVFVGENNSGKSSLFEAIHFIRNKGKYSSRNKSAGEEDSYISLKFAGEIGSVVSNFVPDSKREVFRNHIYEQDSVNYFQVKRSLQDEDEIKKLQFYKKESGEFKNIPAIDSSFQSFFQISNIWADTNPENESKFGASTICGNLLSDISEKFKSRHSDQYEEFLEVFQKTFNNELSGLQADLNIVAEETQEILKEQFGAAKLRFHFDNLEPESLFKNIKILVDDGEETDIGEKGHGMQRAVIISLLQVYARRIAESLGDEGTTLVKPHFLFIDEPEAGLHPQAQSKLFDALCVLSKTHQVFVSTHSENFVSPHLIENIYKFQRMETLVRISSLGDNPVIDLRENRHFFYHHHKLFFSKRAIFVEGADDLERYTLFCKENNFPHLIADLNLMKGSGDFPTFKKFCKYFDIDSKFIFDLDVLASKSNKTYKNFPEDIKNKILSLDKETKKKDPSNLFDENLTPSEQALKREIISDLKSVNLLILQEGAIEQYLDKNGDAVNSVKEVELIQMFSSF